MYKELFKSWNVPLVFTDYSDAFGDKYSKLKEIGKGGGSTVFRASTKQGNIVAIKYHNLDDKRIEDVHYLKNEIESLIRANTCPNINRLIESQYNQTTNDFLFVLEYIPGEELYNMTLKKNKQIPQKRLMKYISDLENGLTYLHKNGIAHRDIKPENVMITKDAKKAVWVDLGLSCTEFNVNDAIVGSFISMAPEVYLGKNTTIDSWIKSDLWSFGCLIYEQCTLKTLPIQERFYEIAEPIIMNFYYGVQYKEAANSATKIEQMIKNEVNESSIEHTFLSIFPIKQYSNFYLYTKNLLNIDPKKRILIPLPTP